MAAKKTGSKCQDSLTFKGLSLAGRQIQPMGEKQNLQKTITVKRFCTESTTAGAIAQGDQNQNQQPNEL